MNCCVKYRSGFKYQLADTFSIFLDALPPKPIKTEYINFLSSGLLVVKKGYAWDGPSGPTLDTASFMRGSLVHDALYQLIREGHLGHHYRAIADRHLYRLCRLDGMNWLRAQAVYHAVRWFADPAARPSAQKEITKSPEDCNECDSPQRL